MWKVFITFCCFHAQTHNVSSTTVQFYQRYVGILAALAKSMRVESTPISIPIYIQPSQTKNTQLHPTFISTSQHRQQNTSVTSAPLLSSPPSPPPASPPASSLAPSTARSTKRPLAPLRAAAPDIPGGSPDRIRRTAAGCPRGRSNRTPRSRSDHRVAHPASSAAAGVPRATGGPLCRSGRRGWGSAWRAGGQRDTCSNFSTIPGKR